MNAGDLVHAFEVQQFVQRTALMLDSEQLPQWLEQFDDAGSYAITSYSTELRKPLTWWEQSMEALRKTIAEVPRHVRDPARRLHVLGVPLVTLSGDKADVVTAFTILRTLPTGETSLFAAGSYTDELTCSSGTWRYRRHCVRLDTRVLDAFTHVPL